MRLALRLIATNFCIAQLNSNQRSAGRIGIQAKSLRLRFHCEESRDHPGAGNSRHEPRRRRSEQGEDHHGLCDGAPSGASVNVVPLEPPKAEELRSSLASRLMRSKRIRCVSEWRLASDSMVTQAVVIKKAQSASTNRVERAASCAEGNLWILNRHPIFWRCRWWLRPPTLKAACERWFDDARLAPREFLRESKARARYPVINPNHDRNRDVARRGIGHAGH